MRGYESVGLPWCQMGLILEVWQHHGSCCMTTSRRADGRQVCLHNFRTPARPAEAASGLQPTPVTGRHARKLALHTIETCGCPTAGRHPRCLKPDCAGQSCCCCCCCCPDYRQLPGSFASLPKQARRPR